MSDQPTTPKTPTTVVPGQIWRDNDQRTEGEGEFTVVQLVTEGGVDYAMVQRGKHLGQIRITRIRVDRLLEDSFTQRGYTYLGMSR